MKANVSGKFEVKMDPVATLLARARLAECSECRSWYFDTRDAKFFHSRRCSG